MIDMAITRTTSALPIRATPLSVVTVVHAIPGRVRLRALVLKAAPALAESLEAMLKAQPGITGANVSRRCHSVTITFDPLCWTPDALCAFLQPLGCEDIAIYEPLPASRDEKTARIHRQMFWIAAACASLVVAIALAALPIVPGGIPFLLLSIYCFSRVIHYSHPQSR